MREIPPDRAGRQPDVRSGNTSAPAASYRPAQVKDSGAAHGGRIGAEASAAQGGARFWFTLPISIAADPPRSDLGVDA